MSPEKERGSPGSGLAVSGSYTEDGKVQQRGDVKSV